MNTFYNIFKYFILPLIVTILIGVILYYSFSFISDLTIWNKFTISKAGENREFCEFHGMELIIRQPANAWSNLSFVFFGILYFVYAYEDYYNSFEDKINYITKYWSFSIIIGFIMLFLGLGSFLFHASLTQFSSRLDITGVVMCCALVFAYSVLRLYSLKNYRQSKIFFLKNYKFFLITLFSFSFLFFLFNFRGREITAILILGTIVLNIIAQIKHSTKINFTYFILSIITISVSIILWLLDKYLICKPTSYMQLHAIWHILTSLTVYLLYLFYRSEILFKYQIKNINE